MSELRTNPVRSGRNFGDGGKLSRTTRRCASASARRPKTVIALWLVFVIGLFMAGSMAGMQMLTGNDQNIGESKAANALLADAGLTDPAVENMMITPGSAAETRAASDSLVARLETDPEVRAVVDPYEAGGQLADDGRKALVQASLRG
ncbi:MAG: hypothetical protein WBW62_07225, partial [Solirubrobacterales bacterium]